MTPATALLGEPAPDFEAPNQRGEVRRLSDYRGRWLVLYFYPKDETPGCTMEACAFRDDFESLAGTNAVVVGVSRDSVERHRRFAENRRLPFDLLSDPAGNLTRAYGARGWFGLTKRITFLISPEGRVAHVFDRVGVARHAAEVRETLERLQKE